mgnify:CR=1 FL=1
MTSNELARMMINVNAYGPLNDSGQLRFFTLHKNKRMMLMETKNANGMIRRYPHLYVNASTDVNATPFTTSGEDAYEVMLFHDSSLRDELSTVSIMPSWRIQGRLFGYPESAITAFIDYGKANGDYNGRIIVNYYGLEFVTRIDLLEQTRRELESMYGLSAVNMRYGAFTSIQQVMPEALA